MPTIQDLARVLGTTVRGVRLRLELLDDLLSPHVHRGTRNEIIVDQAGVALLQRLEDLRKSRQLPLREAAKLVRTELSGNGDGDERQAAEVVTSSHGEGLRGVDWPVRMLVEELRRSNENLQRERDYWREMALKLQEQVRELERLALPAPREGRPWWGRRLFRWLWS